MSLVHEKTDKASVGARAAISVDVRILAMRRASWLTIRHRRTPSDASRQLSRCAAPCALRLAWSNCRTGVQGGRAARAAQVPSRSTVTAVVCRPVWYRRIPISACRTATISCSRTSRCTRC
jgi:hypothetical protein